MQFLGVLQWRYSVALGTALVLAAACNHPVPILAPNKRLVNVEPDAVERDIAECQHQADDAYPLNGRSRPIFLALTTVPQSGVVIGTVGPRLPSLMPNRRFVEQCLTSQGYAVTGWH